MRRCCPLLAPFQSQLPRVGSAPSLAALPLLLAATVMLAGGCRRASEPPVAHDPTGADRDDTSDNDGEGGWEPPHHVDPNPHADGDDAGTDGSSDGDGSDGDGDGDGDGLPDSADADDGPDVNPMDLRVLSLNLHCLKLQPSSFASNSERFAAIAAAIATERVDAIAIQEACKTASVDALEMLRVAISTATGASWAGAWAEAHIAWEGTPDEALEGVGILARGELADVQTLHHVKQAGLTRVALSASLPALGGLRLTSVHLEVSDAAARLAQAREAAAFTVTLADPSLAVLVAGDFNDIEGSAPYGALPAYGFVDLTDALSASRIDHIFAHRGAGLELVRASTIFDGGTYPIVSDHHGVLAHVRCVTPAVVARTRITAHVDVGWASYVSVRGDTAPLTWSSGFPAVSTSPAIWKLVVTEIAEGASFKLKCLRNDTAFQTGANVTAQGGSDVDVYPTF